MLECLIPMNAWFLWCYDYLMKPTDPERERQRLVEEYSNLPDAKLEELAADDFELTDLARKALSQEMERRGLHVDPEPVPANIVESETPDFITVGTFNNLSEALLAKGALESADIECFMPDENIGGLRNAIADVRLQVKREDAEAAIEILDQPFPDEDEEDEGTCDSPDDL